MCTSVFVETETPAALFWQGGAEARGGFGEMTVMKQRFVRWNFFFVAGIWYNTKYMLCSWKLGWWEIGAKIFVFQEVCKTKCCVSPYLFGTEMGVLGFGISNLPVHAIHDAHLVYCPA